MRSVRLVWGCRFRISDFGFRVWYVGSCASGYVFRISSLGFRVSGLGIQEYGRFAERTVWTVPESFAASAASSVERRIATCFQSALPNFNADVQ